MQAMLSNWESISKYMMAGNATLTVVSKKTGTRFTYKVRAAEDNKLHFVNVLCGSNNEQDFKYAGIIADEAFRTTKGSKIGAEAPSVKAFNWLMTTKGMGVEVWHEGHCGRCGRKLTVPESIASGIGPDCAEKGF